MLAADIADARHEAARRGQALHIEGRAADSGGPAWCWSVATAPGCPCGNDGAAHRLRRRAPLHPRPRPAG
ncbi:MAG: GspH/FimT family pseudopilin [Rubrivivax sp.]